MSGRVRHVLKESLLPLVTLVVFTAIFLYSDYMFPEMIPRRLNNPSKSEVPYLNRYAIVVSSATNKDWGEVIEALRRKYPSSILVTYTNVQDLLTKVKKELGNIMPRYVAFVAKPEEAGREFVEKAHTLMRSLDDDPYYDAFFGIITGYAKEDALRIARESSPLLIKNALMPYEDIATLKFFIKGTCVSELHSRMGWMKSQDSRDVKKLSDVPLDVTEMLVNILNNNTVDIFITTGHAKEHQWQIVYNLSDFGGKTGYFRHRNGVLIGRSMDGHEWEIHSTNPKVYWAPGNCLIGHIDGKDCMMTSYLRSCGVVQSIGYTVETWYGYAGWGVGSYFLHSKDFSSNTSFYTFSESFLSNYQSLVFDLERHRNGTVALSDNDLKGHQYDEDVVAFYGDPAWKAYVVKDNTTDFSYICKFGVDEVGIGRYKISFIVKFVREMGGFDRLLVAYPPWRINVADIKNLRTNASYIITDSFIGISPWKPGDPPIQEGKTFELDFETSPLDPVP